MTAKKITASICTAAAIALAGVPAASAQEQRAMSPEQQYAYSCGHLGTDCGGERAKPKKARRACSKRSHRVKSRRRCAARRSAGARRSARRAGARR